MMTCYDSFTETRQNLVGYKGEISGDKVSLKGECPIPRFTNFHRTALSGDVSEGDWVVSEEPADDGTFIFYRPSEAKLFA